MLTRGSERQGYEWLAELVPVSWPITDLSRVVWDSGGEVPETTPVLALGEVRTIWTWTAALTGLVGRYVLDVYGRFWRVYEGVPTAERIFGYYWPASDKGVQS